jgi:hypothetical protein
MIMKWMFQAIEEGGGPTMQEASLEEPPGGGQLA